MKRWVRNILWRIMRWARKKNFSYALVEAQKQADTTGKTQLIVFIDGEYRIYEKQWLKKMRKEYGYFRGMSNEDIENMADLKIYKYVRPKKAG